jgi:predicted DNA-binding transcriptional regulator AlpA
MKDTPRYLTEKEVARLCSISIQTLRNWRHRGQGPKYHKPTPRVVRYRQDDVEKFMESAD